jgi:plasmid stability protein
VKSATRNITFNLPVDLIRRAKVRAAERATSVNGLVRQALEQTLDREAEYDAAASRLIARIRKGGIFKSPPGGFKREDLYDRKVLR